MGDANERHHWIFLRSWSVMQSVMEIVADRVDVDLVKHDEIVTKDGDHYHFRVLTFTLSGIGQLLEIEKADSIDISDILARSNGTVKRLESIVAKRSKK